MQANDNPEYMVPEYVPRPTETMSFFDAVNNVLVNNYANFNGRASRSEFWWWTLAAYGMLIPASFVDGMIFGWGLDDPTWISWLVLLGIFIPNLAVMVRRLHDTNRSGWWILISLIPIIGAIWFIVLLCLKSEEGENQFGPNPLASVGSSVSNNTSAPSSKIDNTQDASFSEVDETYNSTNEK